jgi:hypothetical protein
MQGTSKTNKSLKKNNNFLKAIKLKSKKNYKKLKRSKTLVGSKRASSLQEVQNQRKRKFQN